MNATFTRDAGLSAEYEIRMAEQAVAAAHIAAGRALWRGGYKLAHMSQVLGRDETAEKLAKHAGGTAYSYCLTDDQVEDCRAGRSPHLPYRYLVRSPESSALAWTAFYTRDALDAFCAAYAITIEGDPSPGQSFYLRFPVAGACFPSLEWRQD